jgi:hypothetical protein
MDMCDRGEAESLSYTWARGGVFKFFLLILRELCVIAHVDFNRDFA